MPVSLLQQGVDMTLYGMGIVFLFLTLLVICTILMSTLIARFFPESTPMTVVASSSPPELNPTLLAVIQAAIQEHRTRSR